MGPTAPHSTVLTLAEEAMVVEFRRRTLLPLDDVRRSSWNDVLGYLRDSVPKLMRSSLHRCLERHGISRLPENPNKGSKRGKFAATAIGYIHIDISELCLAGGKLNMFLAIDRVSKFTYVEFRDDAGEINGAEFLRGVEAFPYAIHTVLTDNGMAFVSAYNFAKHLKALRWKTPSKPFATPGRQPPISSNSTRTTSSRDQTARSFGSRVNWQLLTCRLVSIPAEAGAAFVTRS